ncbi:MAG: hypothetical protein KatS3mg002_1001 [Candidatus Woesearchaeota archaeon]|nr:MAG: hypothetical protein KatS3mg002_1001 [Candidatus Woesearchaeota archaeon]
MTAEKEDIYNVLKEIQISLKNTMRYLIKDNYRCPFQDTGSAFRGKVFTVVSYREDDPEQLYNFKWENFTASWYKDIDKKFYSNDIFYNELYTMRKECISEINTVFEKYSFLRNVSLYFLVYKNIVLKLGDLKSVLEKYNFILDSIISNIRMGYQYVKTEFGNITYTDFIHNTKIEIFYNGENIDLSKELIFNIWGI